MWGDWYFKEDFKLEIENTLLKMEQKGVEPGIWVAPFLASPKSDLYKAHPDWFVAGASYKHPTGSYFILDLTHREALEFLQLSMKRLVAMGFKKIKIDFLMTATYPGKRYLNKTGLEAYEMGMAAIREAVGDDVYLLACGAPSLASFPFVDSWRQGADIAFQFPTDYVGPSWTDVVDQLRNLSARWFLCDITSCDLDPLLLRRPHSFESSKAAAWLVALGAGGLYLSDDMRKLDNDRLSWRLPRNLLEQSVSGTAAHPEGVIPAKVSKSLKSPSNIDRVLRINRLTAPERWYLANGELVEFDLKFKRMK
jgi:alpha-galactosidase